MTSADASSNPNAPLPPDTPLHTLNPTQRFSDRASDYRRARPDYAPLAFEAMLTHADPASAATADIGAGTGISTRQLAARLQPGSRIFAIEPNPAMRSAGQADSHPLIDWRDGTGESTGLPSASLDLLLCAQAFHWLRPAEAFAEFHRLLKPTGRFALLNNDRDLSSPVTRTYGRLMREASDNHPAETRHDAHIPIYFTPLFRVIDTNAFSHAQRLTLDGLIARARSSSYCPTAGPKWDRLVEGLTSLHREHADDTGHVRLAYITGLYLAEPV